MNHTSRKIADSEINFGRDKESSPSKEPFGVAYDIDDLPKISMVHTLDREEDDFQKGNTFIEIYPDDVFEHPDEARQDQFVEYMKRRTSTSSMDSIGSSERGILYEAVRNAKRFANCFCRIQREDNVVHRHCDAPTIGRGKCGTINWKQNEKQTRVFDLKVWHNIRRRQIARNEFSRKINCSKGSQWMYNKHPYWKRPCAAICDRSMEENERTSANYQKLSHIRKPVGENKKTSSFSTDCNDRQSIKTNRYKREEVQLDNAMGLEYNTPYQSESDSDSRAEYHVRWFNLKGGQRLNHKSSDRFKVEGSIEVSSNYRQKAKNLSIDCDRELNAVTFE